MSVLRKSTPVLIFAVLSTVAAYLLAVMARFDFDIFPRLVLPEFWLMLVMAIGCRVGAYLALGLNRIDWRFISIEEGWSLVKAHSVSTAALAGVLLPMSVGGYPRSVILLEYVFSLVLVWGTYLAARLIGEQRVRSVRPRRTPFNAVIVGAGFTGHCLVKLLRCQKHARVEIGGVFDDNADCRGMMVHGARVVGRLSDLRPFLDAHKEITNVFLAIPDLPAERRAWIERACAELHVPVRSCSLESLVFDIRDVMAPASVEDLLQRKTNIDNQEEVAEALRDRRVVVTGAGGSIGSDLVRQILRYDPSEMVLIDKCEFNLYSIEQEISAQRAAQTFEARPRVTYHLADLRDRKRIFDIFERHRPHLVFHAAAYKHVPLLETNCYEAFQNNVLGTLNLLHAAKRFYVNRFVQISTDKAVAPANVMGASKRICELMVQQINAKPAQKIFDPPGGHRLQTAVVRFGNVINSAGSVVPLFKKQILQGGPITVTHPEVERYFMSIQEAANLVLIAGTLGRDGEIYMLDMGTPVKLVEVARKMCALYGRRDLAVSFVGLRPGEKLTEELYSDAETREETALHKIFRVCSKRPSAGNIFAWVRFLEQRLDLLADREVAGLILQRAQEDRAHAPHRSASSDTEPDMLDGAFSV